MLSILIPVFNYHVVPLVVALHEQCMATGIAFEILCQDDCSTTFIKENQAVNQWSYCSIVRNSKNFGRGKNLNLLLQRAQYDWVLFLDADTYPKEKHFIQNYLETTKKTSVSISFGGLCYSAEKPNQDQLLRWVYGTKREALSCEFRNKKPNHRALTSNILLKKKIALQNPFPETISEYGYEDLCFLTTLHQKNFFVFHIDNPVFHLNLETSSLFLTKTETALQNLLSLIGSEKITAKDSKIAATFIIAKKLKIVSILHWFFQKTKNDTVKNLCSEAPSLLLFDWYKIGYLCQLFCNTKSL